MIKTLRTISLIILFISTSARAEVIECHSFEPNPGKGSEMFEFMTELAQIMEKTDDVVVNIAAPVAGGQGYQVDYCTRWDNYLAYAKTKDASDKGLVKKHYEDFTKKWQGTSLMTKISSIQARNLDESVKAKDFEKYHAYYVSVFKASVGRQKELLERAKEYEKFVEKHGNQVELYVAGPGGTNELHVLTTNDSWTSLMESWTKLGEDKEFAKFAEADDPTLYQLVKQFNGRTLYPAAKQFLNCNEVSLGDLITSQGAPFYKVI